MTLLLLFTTWYISLLICIIVHIYLSICPSSPRHSVHLLLITSLSPTHHPPLSAHPLTTSSSVTYRSPHHQNISFSPCAHHPLITHLLKHLTSMTYLSHPPFTTPHHFAASYMTKASLISHASPPHPQLITSFTTKPSPPPYSPPVHHSSRHHPLSPFLPYASV